MARVRRRDLLMAVGGGALVATGHSLALPQGNGARSAAAPDPTGDEVGPRYYIYDDKPAEFVPSGLMPDGRGVAQNVHCDENPRRGKYCVRTTHRPADNSWAGVAWLLDGQWFPTRKLNLYEKVGAQRGNPIVLRFYARSKQKAWIEFSSGGGKGDSLRDKLYPGVGPAKVEEFPGAFRVLLPHAPGITLAADWRRYDVDLTGQDLSAVVQVFASVANLASVELPEPANEKEERDLLAPLPSSGTSTISTS